MKKILTSLAIVLFSVSAFAQTPKYVFYMIGDGMGINSVYATDYFNKALGQPEVNFFHFPVRTFVNTWSADHSVTDSAAGGSALATGHKVNNSAIAWSPEEESLESIAEIAQRNGWGTGIISSGPITDATPAVFYAKAPSRNHTDTISRQLIDSQVMFAAGSGFQRQTDKTTDYWAEEAKIAGITVVRGADAYKPAKGRMLMLPKEQTYALKYAIDRRGGETTLADFTAAGIKQLYKNSPKGFFLMVEGAKIDYAAHANDMATAIHEINDFCKSIDLVLDFYKKHPNETLIIVVADHETGGLTLKNNDYQQHPEMLTGRKISKDGLTAKLQALQKRGDVVGWPEVKDLIREETGLWDKVEVSPEEGKYLTQLYKEAFLDGDTSTEKNLKSANTKLANEVINYIDKKAGFCFTTSSHSGAPLGLYVKGAKATEFLNCIENTDVPQTIAEVVKFK